MGLFHQKVTIRVSSCGFLLEGKESAIIMSVSHSTLMDLKAGKDVRRPSSSFSHKSEAFYFHDKSKVPPLLCEV